MQRKERQNRVFSEEFKKDKVQKIEQGKLTVLEVSRIYGVSTVAVYKWRWQYGKYGKDERLVIEKHSEAAKTLSLMNEVSKLEQIIGKQQVELLYKDAIIDLGSDLLGTDLKKKYESSPSK